MLHESRSCGAAIGFPKRARIDAEKQSITDQSGERRIGTGGDSVDVLDDEGASFGAVRSPEFAAKLGCGGHEKCDAAEGRTDDATPRVNTEDPLSRMAVARE